MCVTVCVCVCVLGGCTGHLLIEVRCTVLVRKAVVLYAQLVELCVVGSLLVMHPRCYIRYLETIISILFCY